ncbi:MAG: 7-carboxy-7-deazaguanine synthase QueE [Planctomycetota bacterium]
MSPSPSSELIEIFSAIQGEGPIVGRRQIFVRFGRCDVVCRYCDTPLCHVELPECRIEARAGGRRFERHPNPVEDELLLGWIARLAGDLPHHSVSFTGGEPLLHAATIARLGPAIRELGPAVYLETSGHLTDALEIALPAVDIVGMDVKLPSATGFAERFADNRRFLARCVEAGKDVFCKLVVDAATPDEEIDRALDLVLETAPETLVVLQPVTPFRGVGAPPPPDRMLDLDERALRRGANVVVIPQTHKMIDQR